MAEHLRGELETVIARDFTRSDGTIEPQRTIAKALKISQGQLSPVLKGKNVGVRALVALSSYTGKSINTLLGPSAAVATREEPLVRFAAERAELVTIRRSLDQILSDLAGQGDIDRKKRMEIRKNAELLRKALELLGGQVARDEATELERLRRAAG